MSRRRKKTPSSSGDERPAGQRLFFALLGAFLVVALSAAGSVYVIQRMKEAAHYTTLDLRQLQIALYIYAMKAKISGKYHYPANLQELVTSGAISQSDLDHITRSYSIEYTQPPAGSPRDTLVFVAQRRPAAIVYSAAGKIRIESSGQ